MELMKKPENNIDLDFIFEKKQVVKKGIFNKESEIKKDTTISEEDRKVAFLLENNLLSQIGKLQEIGYNLKEDQLKEYYKRLYQSIVSKPEETLREYLKSNLELPNKFLAVYFLVEIQEKRMPGYLDISKVFTSFFDRVKKGLDNDPVERYKFNKINDKNFVNDLFDFWYESNLKHLHDIETQVTNKRKFLFFHINKNARIVTKDLQTFSEENVQKHINYARNFVRIPIKNEFFFKYVDMDKILKAKELLKRYDTVQKGFHKYQRDGFNLGTAMHQAKLLRTDEIETIVEIFEQKIREHYQKNHEELVEDIKATQSEEYLKKAMTRKLVKGIDDQLLNNLPVEGVEIINHIKENSASLMKKDLTDEAKEIIDFLCKEKLPEVIKKYLNIDNEYREQLKNIQGKNAKELLIESLNIIKDSLGHIEKDINEENLKNLSINTRYIRNAFKN